MDPSHPRKACPVGLCNSTPGSTATALQAALQQLQKVHLFIQNSNEANSMHLPSLPPIYTSSCLYSCCCWPHIQVSPPLSDTPLPPCLPHCVPHSPTILLNTYQGSVPLHPHLIPSLYPQLPMFHYPLQGFLPSPTHAVVPIIIYSPIVSHSLPIWVLSPEVTTTSQCFVHLSPHQPVNLTETNGKRV